MKIDNYFEKAAKDPSYRAEQIVELSDAAKTAKWLGGVVLAVWIAYTSYAVLAEHRWPQLNPLPMALVLFWVYDRAVTKVAVLRALGRQNPPV